MADADRQSDSSARTGEASLNSVEAVTLFASDLPLVEKTEDAPVPEQVWHYGQQDWVEGVLLTEVDVPEMLPGNFSLGKKRYTLGSACFSQISMNLNASILPSAFQSLESSHGVSLGKLELSQSLFLIAYAFGYDTFHPKLCGFDVIDAQCIDQVATSLQRDHRIYHLDLGICRSR